MIFRDFQSTLNFFKKHRPEIVIHCAAYVGGIKFGLDHAAEIYYNNILMSTYLIEAARQVKVEKFISLIADCAYPDVVNKDFKEDEFWDGPLHQSVLAYGMVRKAQWGQAFAYHRQYRMKFISLILPNMYSPGDHFDPERSHALGALLMKIVRAKENNEPEVIKKIVGYQGQLIFDTSRPDGAPYRVMNVARCKKIFKWLPKTSLEEGIKKTYRWYLSHRWKK